MRSSDGEGSRRASVRPRPRDGATWALVFAAAIGIAVVRPVVAARFHLLRVTADVYPLAVPEQMIVASLGYRAALADAIFAHVLVSYGLHFQEKRRFEFVGEYLDTINALDPEFREPYRFADTLLVLSPERPRLEHYQKAREILLRGLARRPYDTELWLTAGQYLAYLAPSNLPTPEMQKAWRLEGAKTLARACELASNNGNVPYHCIAAASLLNAAGERDAAIQSLRRLIAVTDDPEIARLASGFLERKLGDQENDERKRREAAFRDAWTRDLPFVTKNLLLALGPRTDTERCAGPGHGSELDCATSWLDWAALSNHPAPTSE